MLNNQYNSFNLKTTKKQEEQQKNQQTGTSSEKPKTKSTTSWVQVFAIAMCGVLFLFALCSRILYEFRTDDHSNTEVVVGACTFKNNVLIKYDGSDPIVDIPICYEIDGEQYGITEIKERVFYGNSVVEEINMPHQITRVGIFAFRECRNLKKITLSNKIEELGDSCFWNCESLAEIHLPTSLKEIEPYAFWNTAITEIDIPASVKEIGLGAFNRCSKLEIVYIRSEEVVKTFFTGPYQVFSNCPNLKKIYVPAELIEEYKTHEFWSLYADKFTAIGGVQNA